MAHYAKLGANNKVIAVHVVADSFCYCVYFNCTHNLLKFISYYYFT